ncbi:lysozyme [Gemmobacter aquarius]|uniref:Lysozyme n=1 Tax=Paragemmobacter aquarius TaxID=2169400 RepID=A0A2S0UM28_9RHOB|nr:lysozyme [Gemmobacter aquarius]AWB48879.1 lysozyme [Gemmobacter aquarius]
MRGPGKLAGATGAAALVVALAVPMVKAWEGRRLAAYADLVGKATICDGETRGVRMGDTATPAECDRMTAAAVAEFEAAIRPCLPGDLPLPSRAAFTVTAYNIGADAFCASSMARRAMAGNLRGSCDALMMWTKAGGRVVRGLVNRRTAERDLCLAGLQ